MLGNFFLPSAKAQPSLPSREPHGVQRSPFTSSLWNVLYTAKACARRRIPPDLLGPFNNLRPSQLIELRQNHQMSVQMTQIRGCAEVKGRFAQLGPPACLFVESSN